MKIVQILVVVIVAAALGILLALRIQQNKANESRTEKARAARWKPKDQENDETPIQDPGVNA